MGAARAEMARAEEIRAAFRFRAMSMELEAMSGLKSPK
jgi:hypothetical protein